MKRNTVLSLIGIIILIVGAVVAVVLVRQRQLLEQQAAPATNLKMGVPGAIPMVGDSFNVEIEIETGPNLVIGSELYLTFDRSKVELKDIFLGSFLTGAQVQSKTIDNNNGTATYIIFLPTQVTAQTGTGILATLSMTALEAGTASVNFASSTLVAAVGEDVGQNVLVGVQGTSVTIQDTTTTPSPTDIPDLTVTATPTTPATTISATPTSIATSTPTSTSVPTGSPTPTERLVGPSATMTPTTNPDATATATVTTAAGTATATLTGTPQLPDAGVSYPTILGLVAGFVVIVGALFLAL